MPGPRDGRRQGAPSGPIGQGGAPQSQLANGWMDTPVLATATRAQDEAAQVAVAVAEHGTLPVLGRRRRRRFGRRVLWHKGFHWSERNWRKSAWRRQLGLVPVVVAGLVLVSIASAIAIVIAAKASSQVSNRPPTVQATAPLSSGIVLQPSPVAGTPPPPAQDLMGVWVSNPSPPTSGSVQVFVRLTHDTHPLAGVPVSIVVNFPGTASNYGPVMTDGYGLAKFTVRYGGTPAEQPVYVTANAKVDGQVISQQTLFVPQ
jgi:hypothetical protein